MITNIVISILLAILVLWQALRIRRLHEGLKLEYDTRRWWSERCLKTEENVEKLLLVTAPLLEQTDWTTGHWGGQIMTLISLEKKRNANIQAARKVFHDIPIVTDTGVNVVKQGLVPGFTS